MAGITRAERERRQAEAAPHDAAENFGVVAHQGIREQIAVTNALDERAPDRRPATLVDIDTLETAPDNREFSDTLAKAVNQMTGRAAVTENHDPKPAVTNADYIPIVPTPQAAQGEGEEVQLLRGYVPEGGLPVGIHKHVAGEIIRLPKKEAKRLINLGAAKFTEDA